MSEDKDAKSSEEATKEADAAGASVPATRAAGRGSATGEALHDAQRTDIPTGADRGSQVEIVGGEPEADYLSTGTSGDYAPAVFSSNGQIEPGLAPSPSGLTGVPQEGQKTSAEIQAEANLAALKRQEKPLDEQTVARLGGAELRAIGQARGYDLPDGGQRTTRAAFLREQEKDENLEWPKKSTKKS